MMLLYNPLVSSVLVAQAEGGTTLCGFPHHSFESQAPLPAGSFLSQEMMQKGQVSCYLYAGSALNVES